MNGGIRNSVLLPIIWTQSIRDWKPYKWVKFGIKLCVCSKFREGMYKPIVVRWILLAEWLVARDWNLRYFHNKATNRWKKNSILNIIDANGEVVQGDENIAKVVEDYILGIFMTTSPSWIDMSSSTTYIGLSITDDTNRRLLELCYYPKGSKLHDILTFSPLFLLIFLWFDLQLFWGLSERIFMVS